MQNLGIESKVIFVGRATEGEKLLPVFDVCVYSPSTGGTSMRILEAMSFGFAITVSAVRGYTNLVDVLHAVLYLVNHA